MTGSATPAYRIEISPAASRQLRRLDQAARRRVQAAVELLASDPRPPGATKLVGGEDEGRVRTGDHRIVYEIYDQVLMLLVLTVGHRRESYRHRQTVLRDLLSILLALSAISAIESWVIRTQEL